MKIDMRITLALIVAVVLQAAGGFIWTGRAAARLDAVEARTAKTDEMAERLARLEEQTAQVRASLARIERKLERD